MRRVLTLILLLSVCSMAQTARKNSRQAPKTDGTGVTASLLQQEWDAWCTLDPANAAKYYDRATGDVFFDITPLQYHGWAEYESGVKAVLAGFKSVKAKVDEIHIHPAGTANWITAIVHMDYVTQDGKPGKEDWRWTAVWEKRGAEWKIVHEHVSAPLAEPEKK